MLLMLPISDLDGGKVIGREEYSEETVNSYGETANIIFNSFSKEFEKSYPQLGRFVIKEHERVTGAKVDIDSGGSVKDALFTARLFYEVLYESHVLSGRKGVRRGVATTIHSWRGRLVTPLLTPTLMLRSGIHFRGIRVNSNG